MATPETASHSNVKRRPSAGHHRRRSTCRSHPRRRSNHNEWILRCPPASLPTEAQPSLLVQQMTGGGMIMTCVVMIQPVAQAMSKLLLPRSRRLEILEELVCQFIHRSRRGFLAPKLFHSIVDPLESIDLIADHQRGHRAA